MELSNRLRDVLIKGSAVAALFAVSAGTIYWLMNAHTNSREISNRAVFNGYSRLEKVEVGEGKGCWKIAEGLKKRHPKIFGGWSTNYLALKIGDLNYVDCARLGIGQKLDVPVYPDN